MRRFLDISTLIGPLLVCIMVGCSKSTTTTTKSSVAQLSAFSLAANDSFPGMEKAVFKIEERLDTGLVYNPDSIMYGTPLDSVVPKFTFATTPGAAVLAVGDTTIVLTGSDTVNLNIRPIYLSVTSQDASNTKVYEIVATVHQVDPDLFVWTQLTPAVYPADNSEQNVLTLGDKMVLIKNNGFRTSVFTSADGATWSSEQVPTGLPSATRVRSIISDNSMLYYADDSLLYTSTDALTWQQTSYAGSGFARKTMLMAWNETVWALAEDSEGLVLANMQGGVL